MPRKILPAVESSALIVIPCLKCGVSCTGQYQRRNWGMNHKGTENREARVCHYGEDKERGGLHVCSRRQGLPPP